MNEHEIYYAVHHNRDETESDYLLYYAEEEWEVLNEDGKSGRALSPAEGWKAPEYELRPNYSILAHRPCGNCNGLVVVSDDYLCAACRA